MKFPKDPTIDEQKRAAEAEKVDAIQKRVTEDSSLIDRIYGGNAIRRAAFGVGLS